MSSWNSSNWKRESPDKRDFFLSRFSFQIDFLFFFNDYPTYRDMYRDISFTFTVSMIFFLSFFLFSLLWSTTRKKGHVVLWEIWVGDRFCANNRQERFTWLLLPGGATSLLLRWIVSIPPLWINSGHEISTNQMASSKLHFFEIYNDSQSNLYRLIKGIEYETLFWTQKKSGMKSFVDHVKCMHK